MSCNVASVIPPVPADDTEAQAAFDELIAQEGPRPDDRLMSTPAYALATGNSMPRLPDSPARPETRSSRPDATVRATRCLRRAYDWSRPVASWRLLSRR